MNIKKNKKIKKKWNKKKKNKKTLNYTYKMLSSCRKFPLLALQYLPLKLQGWITEVAVYVE